MEKRGCAKVATESVPISINPAWTHQQVSNWLDELFPRLFQYVREHHGRHDTSHMWVLASKEGQKMEMVEIAEPNGRDLVRFKGRAGARIADSHIYIGTLYFMVTHHFLTDL
jgi:hypothetical protein